MSIQMMILDSLPIVGAIPTVWVLICFLISTCVACVQIRKLSRAAFTWMYRLGESVVTFSVLALFLRWPLKSPSSYFSFLSYEDNAGWISTASSFLPHEIGGYSDGAGGFVLDPLIAVVHLLTSGFSELRLVPSLAYQVVGITYALVELLGVLCVGYATLGYALKRLPREGIFTSIGLSLASAGLAYVALQIPRSTGHLTFIGAMTFIWSLGCIEPTMGENCEPSHRGKLLLGGVLTLGFVGMWWPLALVALMMIPARTITHRAIYFLRSAVSVRRSIVLICGLSLVTVSLYKPVSTGFRSMPLREFFAVKGGVQPPPSYSVLVSLLVFVALWFTSSAKSHTGSTRNDEGIQLKVVSLIGALTACVYLASYFIGPEYSQNYTVQKVHLLFVLSVVPLAGIAIVGICSRVGLPRSTFVPLVVVFIIGQQSIGWNLNDPRSVSPPAWADQLLEAVDTYPNSVVLCTTSDPQRNMDAYLCSRHASAVQSEENQLGKNWRHLQVFPQNVTPEDSARVVELQGEIAQRLSAGVKVLLFSLEPTFAIAQEDSWWMNQLPLSQIKIAGTS